MHSACWGLLVTTIDACPNHLDVLLELFDAKGKQFDTAFATRSGVQGNGAYKVIVGDPSGGKAATASVYSITCG